MSELEPARGQVYAVRLAPELGRGGALTGAFVMTGIVTAIAIGIVYWMLRSGELGLWFFAALAIAADVALFRFLANAVMGLRLPDPIVEIDHEPVRRGDEIALSIRQPGPGCFACFEATVSCEVNDGGDIRHRNRRLLFKEGAVVVDQYSPLERTATATIGIDAPVSEKRLKQLTTWKISIKRAKVPFAALDRDYVFQVIE